MNKKLTTAFVFGAAFLLYSDISAAQIENLDVTPAGSQILIEWDKLSDTDMYDEMGYALQWSTVQNDIRNDKIYKTTRKKSENTLTLRAAGFDQNETYYFRVYSYAKDGRKWSLNNGSKILKWEWKTNGDVESEFIDANDPVISNNSTENSSDAFSFGNLSAVEYDTSIQFSWSRSTLPSTQYDGYNLIVSTKNDLSSPIVDISIPATMTKAFIEGLQANTKYYAAGFIKDGSKKIGQSPIKELATIPTLSVSKKNRFEKYVLGKGNLGFRYKVNGSNSTDSQTTTDSDSTSVSQQTDTSNEVAVKARIAELKKLIKDYQAELSKLQKKAQNFKSPTQNSTIKRTIKRRTNSIAERLRARLKSRK